MTWWDVSEVLVTRARLTQKIKTLQLVARYCSLDDQRPTYAKWYLQISPSQPESGAQEVFTRNSESATERDLKKETSYKRERVAHNQVVLHVTHFQECLGFVL